MKTLSALGTPYSLVQAVMRDIWVPIASAATLVVLACISLWMSTPLYEARISITERSAQANPLLQIGNLGLDFLGGIGGASASMTDYDKLLSILASEDTAATVFADEQLMMGLFGDSWDQETRLWRAPGGVSASFKRIINGVFGLPQWAQPGVEPVAGLLRARLRVVRGEIGRSHTISFRAHNPQVASQALNLIIKSADDLIRSRARALNAQNISFLREQLANESTIEVRNELTRQFGQELAKGAILAASTSFSYDTLRELTVSSGPVSPRPLLTLLISFVAGLFVGICIVLVRSSDWIRRDSSQRARPSGSAS